METTREQWLQYAVTQLHNRFASVGYACPGVNVSTAFPSKSALSAKRKRIGECWPEAASADGRCQIFISPLLSDSTDVLAILAHELVHATVGNKEKHNKVFKRCATAIGLEGKMTATTPSDAFRNWATDCLNVIGQYPHPLLTPSLNGIKPQSTRLVKCECPSCGMVVRTTRKWLDAVGAPVCHCPDSPQMIEG